MYDYLIVTHIPVFYKINLYNALSEQLKIHVIFIASETDEKRSSDFINTESIRFSYDILGQNSLQKRPKLTNIRKLRDILAVTPAKKLLVSGWDLLEFWYLVLTSPKEKNYMALESTINESKVTGIRAWMKSFFLSRIAGVFASGSLHQQLLEALNYKGKIQITGGVGLINKPIFSSVERQYKSNYLYVGRLTEVKNLVYLIDIFNQLPDLQLTIIGEGPLAGLLKEKAQNNISFLGQVDNKALHQFYLENDFLLLPSINEPWGLVVEEALYFGLPVMLSSRCGASEIIKQGVNGFIFNLNDRSSLKGIIMKQNNVSYAGLMARAEGFSITEKDKRQVEVYVRS